MIVIFCVEVVDNGFDVEFGCEEAEAGIALNVVAGADILDVVLLIVVPLAVVVIATGFMLFTVFRLVVGINFVVVIAFCVEAICFGGTVGFGREVTNVDGFTVVLVETAFNTPLTVVALIVVPLIVVVGKKFPIFLVVKTILVVVVSFCVEVVGNCLTVAVGFGRKVVVGFRFSFPNGAATELCSNTNNSEIPIKIGLNIS